MQKSAVAFSVRSVVGAPVAVVAWHESSGDEEDQVHEPPDAQAAQRQQLPHGGARVSQAEAVHAETAQEERVQQRGDEVVTRVLDAGDASSEKFSVSGTFDVGQSGADHRSAVHLLLRLASPPDTAVPQLL